MGGGGRGPALAQGFACPHCGQTDIPAPTNGGGVEECPSCGHAFALPEPALLRRDEAPVSQGEVENNGLVGGPTDGPLGSRCLIGRGRTLLHVHPPLTRRGPLTK